MAQKVKLATFIILGLSCKSVCLRGVLETHNLFCAVKKQQRQHVAAGQTEPDPHGPHNAAHSVAEQR